MMKSIILHGCLLFSMVVCACADEPAQFVVEPGGSVNPWTHTAFNDDDEAFQFAIVSDRAGGLRPGVFDQAVDKLNLLQPEFVISIGDLIEGETHDEANMARQWDEFDAMVNRLEMPFFYVGGNHDIGEQPLLSYWKQRYGKTYYHFVYKNVLFLCLNSEGGTTKAVGNHLDEEQLAYFRRVLDAYPSVRWTLVFVHRPMWLYPESNWNAFEPMLADRSYTVFAGHLHQYAIETRNGRKYIRLATTGGAITLTETGMDVDRHDLVRLGVFDHVTWVTMKNDGPRIANLMLDGIQDEKVTPAAVADLARTIKKQIDRGGIIQYDVLADPSDAANTIVRVQLANKTLAMVKVEGIFKAHPDITVSPDHFSETLLPKMKKTLDITLGQELSSIRLLTPLVLDGRITFTLPGFHPVVKTNITQIDVNAFKKADMIKKSLP